MNKQIKKRWTKALRSGDYPQTRGALRNQHGFCCLGVLCDLYRKDQKKRLWEQRSSAYSILGEDKILPRSVIAWAGVDDRDPVLGLDFSETASHLNDTGQDFSQIADAIEANM